MLREKLQQLINQPKQAALGVAVLSAIPLLHLLGLLLMLVVTLRRGWRIGFMLALLAAGTSGLLAKFALHDSMPQVFLQVFNPLLLCLLAVVLFRTASWQKVIELITVIGLFAVLFLYHFYPESTATWSATLTENLRQMVSTRPSLLGTMTPNEWQNMLTRFGSLATGLRVLLLLGTASISLIMARYVQATLYNPGGLKAELYYWHFSYRIGGLITLLLTAAYIMKTPVWLSMTPVLMLPLIGSGLSLIHFVTGYYKYQVVILLLFYASIITIAPQLLILVMFLGYADCFINFRKYFTPQKR